MSLTNKNSDFWTWLRHFKLAAAKAGLAIDPSPASHARFKKEYYTKGLTPSDALAAEMEK